MIRMSVLIAALALSGPAMAQTVPEPQDFQGEPYRSPVPATLAGAEVIDADRALSLHDEGVAAFVDVLPRNARRPDDLPEGTIWNEPPHVSIPGAVWLWDTGYQRLSPEEEARLRDGLETAKAGDPARHVVVFCRSECWMSWNAAKRAAAWGFDPVLWFPGGVDAWTEAGGELVTVPPVDP